jgi:hypothetical protein
MFMGFGRQHERLERFQEHRVPDALAGRGRTYGTTIFGIVKYFQLAIENNPNAIEFSGEL